MSLRLPVIFNKTKLQTVCCAQGKFQRDRSHPFRCAATAAQRLMRLSWPSTGTLPLYVCSLHGISRITRTWWTVCVHFFFLFSLWASHQAPRTRLTGGAGSATKPSLSTPVRPHCLHFARSPFRVKPFCCLPLLCFFFLLFFPGMNGAYRGDRR